MSHPILARRAEWEFTDGLGRHFSPGSAMAEVFQRHGVGAFFSGGRLSTQEFFNWFQENRATIEASEWGDERAYRLYTVIARNLVDIFVENPEAWNILNYMSPFGPIHPFFNQSLEDYFLGWRLRTPKPWQKYVTQIAWRMGIGN